MQTAVPFSALHRSAIRMIVLAAFICFPFFAFSETITTLSGKVYQDAVVWNVEPDGLRIAHRDGVAKVPFESLPDSMRRRYHYDPELASEYRKYVAKVREATEEFALSKQQRAEEAPRAGTEDQKKDISGLSGLLGNLAQSSGETSNRIPFLIAGLALVVGIYFAPTLVAQKRGHTNTMAIFTLNFCLGWSVLGWVAAMVWACMNVGQVEE